MNGYSKKPFYNTGSSHVITSPITLSPIVKKRNKNDWTNEIDRLYEMELEYLIGIGLIPPLNKENKEEKKEKDNRDQILSDPRKSNVPWSIRREREEDKRKKEEEKREGRPSASGGGSSLRDRITRPPWMDKMRWQGGLGEIYTEWQWRKSGGSSKETKKIMKEFNIVKPYDKDAETAEESEMGRKMIIRDQVKRRIGDLLELINKLRDMSVSSIYGGYNSYGITLYEGKSTNFCYIKKTNASESDCDPTPDITDGKRITGYIVTDYGDPIVKPRQLLSLFNFLLNSQDLNGKADGFEFIIVFPNKILVLYVEDWGTFANFILKKLGFKGGDINDFTEALALYILNEYGEDLFIDGKWLTDHKKYHEIMKKLFAEMGLEYFEFDM